MIAVVHVTKLIILHVPDVELICFLKKSLSIAAAADTYAGVMKCPIVTLTKMMDLIEWCTRTWLYLCNGAFKSA